MQMPKCGVSVVGLVEEIGVVKHNDVLNMTDSRFVSMINVQI